MPVSIMSILLILSLLAGGAGATVYAAQDSLPDQTLYNVKILSEEISAYLASGDEARLALQMQYANRRVEEAITLCKAGVDPSPAVLDRLQRHLDQALSIIASMGEDQMIRTLLRLRANLQKQEQSLSGVPDPNGLLIQIRKTLRARLQWTEFGLDDPSQFRWQVRARNHFNHSPDHPGEGPDASTSRGITPTAEPAGGGYGPGFGITHTPTHSCGFSAGHGASPTTGNGNGYGSGPHATCTPTPGNGSGYGPGPGQPPDDRDGFGPGPYAIGTPTPGSGYGPGPGLDPTCTPGAGNGPTPDPGTGGGSQTSGSPGDQEKGGRDH